jgi:small conductance mechanosensitive channel
METLLDWVSTNQNLLLSYAHQFIVALLIFGIGQWLARKLSNGCKKLFIKRNFDQAIASFFSSLIYAGLLIVVVIAAISHLGFNTTSLVAILGAAGLAIGLSLQGSLSNFASGVLIVTFKPFKSGDYVEVAGISGVVKEIQIFSTMLTTPDNKRVIVPNSSVTGSAITNFSAMDKRRVDLTFGVSYDADIRQVKKLLTEIVNQHPLVLKEQEPVIAVAELADSSVNFVVRPWVKTPDYWTVHFEITETVKLELDKAGIEIPYPQLSMHINQENKNDN